MSDVEFSPKPTPRNEIDELIEHGSFTDRPPARSGKIGTLRGGSSGLGETLAMGTESSGERIGADENDSDPTEQNLGRRDAAFVRTLREHVGDLLRPSPAIFWGDMIASAVVGYAGLFFFLTRSIGDPLAWVGFTLAGAALYRGLMFIHELAHLRRGTFAKFRIAWNFLFGMPLMMPSFLYTEHRTHHTNHSYGTDGDAEYYPIGLGPVGLVFWFVAQGFVIPILGVLRFAIIGPVSFLHPRLRTLVWQKASGLAQNNLKFSRPDPTPDERWGIWAMEAGATACIWTVLGLMIAGVVPWWWLGKLYVLFACVTVLSMARALASHLYLNQGDKMSYLDQMFDSTTIPGRPLVTEIWAPLGQRYHALHHLIPSIPYHSLGTAHRRLMANLPGDSPYHQTIRPSFLAAIGSVWVRAGEEAAARRKEAERTRAG